MKIHHKHLPLILFLLSAVLCLFLLINHLQVVGTHPHLSNLQARTENNRISLKWESYNTRKYKIEINISSGDYQETVELKGDVSEWSFISGQHGRRYNICIQLKNENRYVGERITVGRMFLDESKLPNIPIVRIETAGSQEPTCSYVTAPDGLWGMSISDNAYIPAIVSVMDQGISAVNCTGQLRVRGNTSAYLDKKPFKLKLDRKADLLNRGNDAIAQEDWVLMPADRSLSTETAMLVASKCGLSWLPDYTPVNVVINGDWRGCYLLMEAVTAGENKVSVGNTGFIIENNAYWWKDAEVYFRTQHQVEQLAFTFKYPYASQLEQADIDVICDYMNSCEVAILEDGDRYRAYIDVESFVAWLMTHDIMGSYDAGGSNMFLYKYDLDPNNPNLSKLKMGPVWDFTSAFTTKGDWSSIHKQALLHYDVLTQKQSFMDDYRTKWQQVSGTLTEDVLIELQTYVHSRDNGYQKSMELDAECWQTSVADLDQSLTQVQVWMQERIEWMDGALLQE